MSHHFNRNLQINADEGAEYTVTYTSSNPSVARVDKNGKVYGAKKGSADITVTVTDSYGNSVSDTCKVNVKYTFGQWLLVIVLFGWIWY
ncbi:MAG: Ig-like domain-containing protein [Clostridiaceae bacterium]|nr:Ig-like domain-containing protein [Clostridiaceae bacterium]